MVKRALNLKIDKLLVVVILMAASGLAVAQSWRALVSPGDPSPGHAEFGGDCDKCHLVFSGVPNEKCLGCHKFIAKKQEQGEGFHASVARQSCQDCHVDHQGPGGKHTSASAMKSFDHEKTGFSLKGEHGRQRCQDCHQQPLRKMKPSCTSCHADTHRGALGPKCTTCHASTGWDKVKSLAEHSVTMTGGHKGQTCRSCHSGGRALVDARKSKCMDCHTSDKHGGIAVDCKLCHEVKAFTPAEHSHAGCTCVFPGKHQTFECLACHKGFKFAGTPTRCSGCHATQKHAPLGECSKCHSALSWKDNLFDHDKRSKFPITGKHLEVACVGCHKSEAGKRVDFRAVGTSCKSCHEEKGEAAHGDFGACTKCHTTAGFDQSSFDHGKDGGFPLVGKHAKASCQSCHKEKTQGYPKSKKRKRSALDPARPELHGIIPGVTLASADRWLSPPTTASDARAEIHAPAPMGAGDIACSHCHETPHEPAVSTSCADCHTSEGWSPSTFTVEAHASTKLPLTGKHARTSCKLCHVKAKLVGLPLECAGCHVDVHRGKIGADCTKCHTTEAFSPVPDFSHALTGFEITKQHAKVSCRDCHGQKREKKLSHVKGPLDCQACHKSGHATFDLDCVACHLPEDTSLGKASGTAKRIDHRDTGFPLVSTHAVLPCSSCHMKDKPKPIPSCASCHTDVHSGAVGFSCKDCHRADRWSLIRFDHDRASFPLRGRHSVTPCLDCHTNQSFVGQRTDCFDCHQHDVARAPEHGALATSDCRLCHRSVWRW